MLTTEATSGRDAPHWTRAIAALWPSDDQLRAQDAPSEAGLGGLVLELTPYGKPDRMRLKTELARLCRSGEGR